MVFSGVPWAWAPEIMTRLDGATTAWLHWQLMADSTLRPRGGHVDNGPARATPSLGQQLARRRG